MRSDYFLSVEVFIEEFDFDAFTERWKEFGERYLLIELRRVAVSKSKRFFFVNKKNKNELDDNSYNNSIRKIATRCLK